MIVHSKILVAFFFSIELRMTNTCINNFFVSVSIKSQLFRLRHTLNTILSGITTSTVASRFSFLVLFYLNSAMCEILLLGLFLSLSPLSCCLSFPFWCKPCKTSTRWWILAIVTTNWDDVAANNSFLHIFTLAYLSTCFSIHVYIHTYIHIRMIDHSLDIVSTSSHRCRHSRSLSVSKQTYLNNKSSIIWYWSDCEIEEKELHRWMM